MKWLFGKKKEVKSDKDENHSKTYPQIWLEQRRKERREDDEERKKKERQYLRQAHLTLISVLISGIAIGISICTMLIRCGVLGGD